MKNATVEFWQCDAHAVYLHSSDSVPKQARQDKNFQGFGRFETASSGEYCFRTIKPAHCGSEYRGHPAYLWVVAWAKPGEKANALAFLAVSFSPTVAGGWAKPGERALPPA